MSFAPTKMGDVPFLVDVRSMLNLPHTFRCRRPWPGKVELPQVYDTMPRSDIAHLPQAEYMASVDGRGIRFEGTCATLDGYWSVFPSKRRYSLLRTMKKARDSFEFSVLDALPGEDVHRLLASLLLRQFQFWTESEPPLGWGRDAKSKQLAALALTLLDSPGLTWMCAFDAKGAVQGAFSFAAGPSGILYSVHTIRAVEVTGLGVALSLAFVEYAYHRQAPGVFFGGCDRGGAPSTDYQWEQVPHGFEMPCRIGAFFASEEEARVFSKVFFESFHMELMGAVIQTEEGFRKFIP